MVSTHRVWSLPGLTDRGHWPGQSYQEFDLRTHNPTHLLVQTLPGERDLLAFSEQNNPKIAHSMSKVYQTITPLCYPLFNFSTHAGHIKLPAYPIVTLLTLL